MDLFKSSYVWDLSGQKYDQTVESDYKAYKWPVQGEAFSVFPNGWVIKSRTQALGVPLAGLSI